MVYEFTSFKTYSGESYTKSFSNGKEALRYAKRHGLVITDSWPENDPPPVDRLNDADAWNRWRLRGGIAS